MIRRRPTQVFSLAFLDCICCGFGAVILIFVLSVDSREKDKVKALAELQVALQAQLASLAKLNEARPDLEQKNARLTTMLVDARLKNDSIHAMLDDLEGQLQREKKGQEALLVDVDDLKKEIAARQKKSELAELPNVKPAPIGLPITSNYIAFIIDCSGSMRDVRTDALFSSVIQKIEEVLDSYPKVEGMQFFDADGRVIMRGFANEWIPDTPENRADVKRTLRRYRQDNISDPVPGIAAAIRILYEPANEKMKMGLFVVGDEFASSNTGEATIRAIDRLDPPDENGNHKIVINAIGFPTLMEWDPFAPNDLSEGSQLKFANLMRELCYRHGGAFIALRDVF